MSGSWGDSIARAYADWAGYQRRIAARLGAMSEADLGLAVEINGWPIWAVAGHTAGARVYWLCHVLGEPGAETTPFTDPTGFGWEDDLTTVRSRDDVVRAFDTSWRVVAGCLERWTPPDLDREVRRTGPAGTQVHTRQSILLRLLTHEAYHAGEISLTLARHGGEPIDLWPTAEWLETAAEG